MNENRRELMLLAVPALGIVLFHLLTANGSGYFRDELYYVACSEHLGLGFVDHPPLVAWITRLSRAILGDSLLALRFLPAVAHGATVLLTGLIARELGAGRFAQQLAALATAVAPVYLAIFGILSMNAYDILLWTAALLVVTRLLGTGDQRLWLWFGVIAGVALQNKISMLFLGFGLTVGLLAARQWRQFTSRWLWLGGVVAGLIFLPHLLWQVSHGWPTLEFMDNASSFKNVRLAPLDFIGKQVLQMNPATLPLWLAGLVWLLVARDARRFQPLGFAYLATLALMVTQNSKPYYLAAIYPVLFAAGALVVERAAARRRLGWLRPVAAGVIVLAGAVLAPLAKPVLPVESYVSYAAALGQAPGTSERKRLGRLPQFFADRNGWPELAATVSEVFVELPDREQACVFGQNYGHAGAIDFFRGRYELPPAISGHNSYALWGPGSCTGQVMIVIDDDREDLENLFESVELAARYTCEDCMPYESDKPIWVCRGLRTPLDELWPKLRHLD